MNWVFWLLFAVAIAILLAVFWAALLDVARPGKPLPSEHVAADHHRAVSRLSDGEILRRIDAHEQAKSKASQEQYR